MLKKYDIKSYEKIIVLIAVLILPAEGNTQANNNKIINNPQNIRNPPPKQKQIKKAKKPQGELLKSKKLHMTPKELQEKLLFVNTGLANATKSIKELEK